LTWACSFGLNCYKAAISTFPCNSSNVYSGSNSLIGSWIGSAYAFGSLENLAIEVYLGVKRLPLTPQTDDRSYLLKSIIMLLKIISDCEKLVKVESKLNYISSMFEHDVACLSI
jgi:hypothetical protein